MDDQKKQYQFVNGQTGYVIAYLTVDTDTHPDSLNQVLENRKKELAIEHGIFVDTIYWKLGKE